jgi:hypothetical protein
MKKENTQPKILHDLKLGEPIKGDLPKTRIIGGDYSSENVNEKELSTLPQIQKKEHVWEAYQEYNKNILDHPEYVNEFVPRDNHLLIRCFKFEEEETTEGGIIMNNDVEWVETPGGQMVMKTSANPYQKRGVVVKKGFLPKGNEFFSSLNEGSIVILSTNKLDSSKFDTEPSKKGSKDLGYFFIHVGLVQGIENS